MKTVSFFLSLFFLYNIAAAQSTYTGAVPGTMPPGNQAQPPDLYNGGSNNGQPGQNNGGNGTVPNSTSPASPINPINPTNPAYPSSTGSNPVSPGAVSPTMPNPTTFPTTPGTPTLNTQINLLFLPNPTRTPKTPKASGPVTTVDGSTGKYKSQHPTISAKKNGFTTNHRTKSAGASHVSREKTSRSNK